MAYFPPRSSREVATPQEREAPRRRRRASMAHERSGIRIRAVRQRRHRTLWRADRADLPWREGAIHSPRFGQATGEADETGDIGPAETRDAAVDPPVSRAGAKSSRGGDARALCAR